MPNFKPKTNRKIKFNKKTSITLDGKHKEFLNEFYNDENVIMTIDSLKQLKEIHKNGNPKTYIML